MRKTKRLETFEESTVGFTILLAFLIALALFVALLYLNLTPIFLLHDLFGSIGLYSGQLIMIFFLHAVVSLFLAFFFHFTRRQLKMLAKVALLIDALLPCSFFLLFICSLYVIEITSMYFPFALLMALGYIMLIVFLKKFFGDSVYGWIHIRYVPTEASLEVAEKHLNNARIRQEREEFEGASEEFHVAALLFLRLDDLPRTAENYLSAAEMLSKESDPDFGFRTAWLYALSAAAYHLSEGGFRKAEKALKLGKQTLEDQKINKKTEEKALLMLDFLEAMLKRDTKQTDEIWQNLNKRIGKWRYPMIEETQILLEKLYQEKK